MRSTFFGYSDHCHVFGLLQERQGIPNGAASFANVLPGDCDPLWRERCYRWRDDQNRTTSFQKDASGVESPKRIGILRLVADDNQIGRPRLTRKHFGWKIQVGPPVDLATILAGYSDNQGVEAIRQIGSNPDAPAQFAVDIDMHHEASI